MTTPPTLREQLDRSLDGVYRLERELTAGGMSRVFLATELRFERRVVLKVLAPELAAGVSVERFRREVNLAARLQQANIVPVLDAGDVGGLPYYTMPWVEGESLAARLETRGRLPVGDAIAILQDVLRALQYAHDQGVVHRDIKPGNILLSGRTAVVTDFGIAKAISASRTLAPFETLTQVGTSLGTPAYMAPEQAMGDPDTDHRADLYALGVVGYELLTGERPFLGTSPQELVRAHLLQPPAPVADRVPGLPAAVADLVMRLLAKEPRDRPQSAEECLRVLAANPASGLVTPATPVTAAPARSAGAARWRRPAAAATALVVLAAAAGLILPSLRTGAPTAGAALDPAQVRLTTAAGGEDAALALSVTRRLLGSLPGISLVEEGAGTIVSVNASAVGGDSLRLEYQVQDASNGRLLRSLRPATAARVADDGTWSRALDGLLSTVAIVAQPLLGPGTLPLGDPPKLAAVRDLITALQVGRNDSASMAESDRRLDQAIRSDSTYLQVRLWRAGTRAGRIVLSYDPRARRALMDTVAALQQHRERMSPFEVAMLDFLRANAANNSGARLDALRRLHELSPNSLVARNLPTVLLDLNRPREALALLMEQGPVRDAQGQLIMPDRNVQRWTAISDIQHYLGNARLALEAARRARELAPGSLATLRYATRAAAALGDSAGLEDLLAIARGLPNDYDSYNYWGDVAMEAGQELRAHGHPAHGEAVVRRALAWFEERQPQERTYWTRFRHALTCYNVGEYRRALAMSDSLEGLSDILVSGFKARAAVGAGDTALARRLDRSLEAMGTDRLGSNTLERAFLAARLGERDRAVALLQEAFAQGQGFSIRWRLHWLPDVLPLRGYPPFDQIMTPAG